MSAEMQPKREVKLSENELKVASIVLENAPLSYKEVVGKYNEAEKAAQRSPVTLQYVANIINHLADEGVVTTTQEGNKKLVKLEDGVILAETKAFAPTGLMATPEDRLKQVLNLYNVKGDVQQKIISILALNPAMDNAQTLFGVLVNLRVEPSNARNIVETYYGAQQYAAGMAAAAGRAGFFPQQGMMVYPPQPGAYPQFPQPQPMMMYQQTPQGLVPVMMAGPSVPASPQPAPQPVIIKTGETRKVRRPMTDKDGNVKKDPETKETLYEETEEPVVLTAGAGGTEGVLLKLLLESGGLGGGKYREKYEEEKEKRVQDQIEQVRKESSENIQGLVGSVNKNQAELVKVFTDSMEKMQHGWDDKFKDMAKESQHAAELAAVRGSAGERPIVSITKEVTKAVREGFGDIRATLQTVYRPGLPGMPQGPGPAPPMTEEQMLAEARNIREKASSRTQHA